MSKFEPENPADAKAVDDVQAAVLQLNRALYRLPSREICASIRATQTDISGKPPRLLVKVRLTKGGVFDLEM
jgi:hypothetical protein